MQLHDLAAILRLDILILVAVEEEVGEAVISLHVAHLFASTGNLPYTLGDEVRAVACFTRGGDVPRREIGTTIT